ncbi:putative TBCC domain-containing protein 1-like [Apostichopus japonicus]|uniref:TBCC domain-containing protein 1 n=1 Tax=Stichopus japonicus TaxID=307972 RepID=A0A2G8LJ89_STIJA|nr:putative TBCC domain-containing protein 1-like [Apostichopus japonicus]
MEGRLPRLWLRTDPFTSGALQVAPHPKLNLHYLKKIGTYAQSKGKSGFPKLSYSVWRHIACHKLSLTENLAELYFQGFQLLNSDVAEERRKGQEQLSAVQDEKEKELVLSRTSVDTLQFLLYLFIQQVHKVSLRSSLVAGQEWPLRPRSPDLDGRAVSPSSGSPSKGLDESNHLSFILSHLSDILTLLAESDAYSSSATDLYLSTEAVTALGLLIEGTVAKDRNVQSLIAIAKIQTVQASSGFSKITQAFSFRLFETWIRNCLVNSPFGVAACISAGQRLNWPTTGGDMESGKRGKIASNASKAPKSHTLVFISQVCKQTLAKSSNTLTNSRVRIHRCRSSYLYLLSPMKSVNVDKCRNSTIVLGPVETTVHLHSCEQVTLIAVAGRVSISSSTLCTLHVLTPLRPLILGGNDTIILAPYHTHYPQLEAHMASVGLTASSNLWDKPLPVGPDHQEELPVFSLLPLEEFSMFSITFRDGRTYHGGLPHAYAEALSTRQSNMKKWQAMVRDSGLDKEQRKQFQELVETKFQIWLGESNNSRQLDDLAAGSTFK